jgi:hypothetical protein
MKAMCMVAHPDDCVIFAYSYIHNHPEYSWTVCYLTYTKSDDRGIEFSKFWNQRDISVEFLGFDDRWDSIKNCPGVIDADLAQFAIQQVIRGQDLILTHNSTGEYGHPHHIIVHDATVHHPNRVIFAGPGQGTVKYQIESGIYSLDELPLHKDIIMSFHKENHTNEYTICKNI